MSCLIYSRECYSDCTPEAFRPEQEKSKPGLELADEIYPDRIKSVEEWMRATGYTGVCLCHLLASVFLLKNTLGEAKAEMKLDEDQAKTF